MQGVHPQDVELVATAWRDLALGNIDNYNLKFRFLVGKDKKEIWVLGQIRIEKSDDGELIVGTITDISEIIAKKKEVERLSNVVKQIENAVIITNAEGEIEWVNEGFTTLTGYNLEDVIEKKPGSFLQGKETTVQSVEAIRKGLTSKKPFTVELVNYSKTHRRYDIALSITPVLDDKNNPVRFIGITTDITERKKAELELKRLSNVVKRTDHAAIITDADGNTEWVNEGFVRLMGYTLAEVKGRKPGDVLQRDPLTEEKRKEIHDGLESGEPFVFEIENYKKSGKLFHLSMAVTPIFNDSGQLEQFLGLGTDITKRKKAQNEIRRLSNVVKQIENAVIITSPTGSIEWVNDGFTALTGYSLREVIGKVPGTFLQGADTTEESRKEIRKGIDSKKPFTAEIVNYSKTGRRYNIALSISPILDKANNVVQFIGISTDISERVLSEQILQESEERLQSVLENSPDGVLVTNQKGEIIFFNRQAQISFGYTEREVLGKRVEKLIPQRFHRTHRPDREKYETKPRARNMGSGQGLFGLRKDGSEFPVDIQLRPIHRRNEKNVMAVVRDVTELKKIEQERLDFTANLERQVKERTLALEQSNELLAEFNKDVKDSINYAQKLQRAVLPERAELEQLVTESVIYYRPKDVVSGDFYWFTEVSHGAVIIAADCTGHGVPGAFMSMLGIELLNNIVAQRGMKYPSFVLEQLDDGLKQSLSKSGDGKMNDGMDLCIVTIDRFKKRFMFAGAGRPLIQVSGGEMNYVRGSKYGVGGDWLGVQKDYETYTFDYKDGDMIYLFSDGYADQFGGDDGKKMMIKRLKQLLLDIHHLPCKQQHKEIRSHFEKWIGDYAQVDDVLVMGVRL
ncbi:PAS domain S-box protein [Bacteroidota bacterium]